MNESVASIIEIGEDGGRVGGGTAPQPGYFHIEFDFILRQQGLCDLFVKLRLHRGRVIASGGLHRRSYIFRRYRRITAGA